MKVFVHGAKSLLRSKGPEVPPLAVWYLVARPRKGLEQQGSSAAHCAGVHPTRVYPPRRGHQLTGAN